MINAIAGTISDTFLFKARMKNPFFKIALAQAARLVGQRGRILKLASQLIFRLDHTHFSAVAWRERLHMLGRLVASFARGRYRAIPLKPLLMITAALLYFLNPFDLVPDAILGVGLTDDLAVLALVYRVTQQELDKFMIWESTQVAAVVV